MNDEEVEAYLNGYNQLPGTQDEKFQKYVAQIRTGTMPGVTSLRETFALVKKCKNDGRVRQINSGLYKRRFLVVYGDAGMNHGYLKSRGTWDPEKKMYMDGVIVLSSRYEGNWIGSACVLAHELRHVLDIEETQLGRLDIGIDATAESLNKPEPQRRANVNAGGVATALGWRGFQVYSKMIWREKEQIEKEWGKNWDWKGTLDMPVQIDDQVELFKKFLKEKHGLKAQKCGRPCKDPKLGLCGRSIYFPPCWDH